MRSTFQTPTPSNSYTFKLLHLQTPTPSNSYTFKRAHSHTFPDSAPDPRLHPWLALHRSSRWLTRATRSMMCYSSTGEDNLSGQLWKTGRETRGLNGATLLTSRLSSPLNLSSPLHASASPLRRKNLDYSPPPQPPPPLVSEPLPGPGDTPPPPSSNLTAVKIFVPVGLVLALLAAMLVFINVQHNRCVGGGDVPHPANSLRSRSLCRLSGQRAHTYEGG